MQIGFTYYHTRNNKLKNWLLAQDVETKVMLEAAKAEIAGYTLLKGIGVWEGKAEPTLQLQIEGEREGKVIKLAKRLKELYNQDSVMVKTNRGVTFV